VSGTSYLSIGDVLALLRREFPDVTISKIRFLESQGLVTPERTPSGYRKFYEEDVEQLRWVLRQQREHFLPLKVIKGRLEGKASPDGSVQEVVGVSTRDPGDRGAADAMQASRFTAGVTAGGSPSRERFHPAGGPAAARNGEPERVVATQVAPEVPGEPSGREPVIEVPPGVSPIRSPRAVRRSGAAPLPGFEEDGPDGAPESGAEDSRSGQGAHPARSPDRPNLSDVPSGASLTFDELSAASGLTASELQALEGFGLMAGRPVAGSVYYDEDALVVARLAASFGRIGVEPRHLRLYKNAADREAGFIAQVVMPLVRQRNPEARQRAAATADELTRLGQQLRGALLKSQLRNELGG
jgi:DNA-binding transcriptional MerR regulator